ncbi:MAG: hypothetical protein WKF34_09150 [Pyrinomonadaceae bacterium]
MRVNRYNFLFVLGLVVTLGFTTAFASDHDRKKWPKNTGKLSVKTSEVSYPVKVDGQYMGMTGVDDYATFYLPPGIHTLEVTGPDGRVWVDEVMIRRDRNHCICLKIIRETITTPCPYRFSLDGPERITEGDLVTFAAINSGTAPIPIRYAWRVTNGRITSGLGTPTITVDSAGIGNGTITAELDVNDDTYDNKCRQLISVPTEVVRIPEVIQPKPFRCDEFEAKAPDDDKARFDNCVIQAQNTPDAQLYVVIYPGTDRLSTTRNTYDRLSKRALDYMVKTRGFDPRRISIVKGSTRLKTTYELWIVPPGATLPVVQ